LTPHASTIFPTPRKFRSRAAKTGICGERGFSTCRSHSPEFSSARYHRRIMIGEGCPQNSSNHQPPRLLTRFSHLDTRCLLVSVVALSLSLASAKYLPLNHCHRSTGDNRVLLLITRRRLSFAPSLLWPPPRTVRTHTASVLRVQRGLFFCLSVYLSVGL